MDKALIIQKLSPFEGRELKLVDQQTVTDIIPELLNAHKKYSSEYDKIYQYFLGNTPHQTLKNCWNFLKKNVRYRIESENRQKLCSPSAIVALGNVGLDCKNYSLFTAGILAAANRSGVQKIPFCFRFASYRMFDPMPHHVFIVAYPNTKKEVWIDPVLKSFNEKKPYNYKQDKMALYSISGVDDNSGKQIGVFKFVKKVGGAPTRGAFLALVSLNAFGLGKKMKEAYASNKEEVLKWWFSQGGKRTPLERAIRKGGSKRRLFGDEALGAVANDLQTAFEGNTQIGVAPAALAAKAARIIKSFTKFLKKLKQLKQLKKLQQIKKLQKLKNIAAKTQKIRSAASKAKSAVMTVKQFAESAPTSNQE